MTMFSKVDPITENRFTIVPAEPGWFVFSWEGAISGEGERDYKLFKAPIVAWHIVTEYYPHKRWRPAPTAANPHAQREEETGAQDFFSHVTPIQTGGVDCGDDPYVIAPDGTVYDLNSGTTWHSVTHHINEAWDKMDAEEADALKAAPK